MFYRRLSAFIGGPHGFSRMSERPAAQPSRLESSRRAKNMRFSYTARLRRKHSAFNPDLPPGLWRLFIGDDTTRRNHTPLKTNTQRHSQTGVLVTAVLSSSGALRASHSTGQTLRRTPAHSRARAARPDKMLHTVTKIEKKSPPAAGRRTPAPTRRPRIFANCSPVAPARQPAGSEPSNRPDRHLPKYQLTDSKDTIGFVRSVFNAPQTT